MKILTWNVNSIRARMHLVPEVLEKNNINIAILQEIKCMNDQFPCREFEELGYNCVVQGQKTRNGVAILSKHPVYDEVREFPLYGFDERYEEARYVETRIDIKGKTFRIGNGYFPNGSPLAGYEGIPTDSVRFLYKLEFFDRFLIYIKEQIEKYPDEIYIYGGDFNVMHKDIDVYNPKNWKGQIAFLPEEKERLDKILELGFVDVFRYFNPEAQEYTWWDYRAGGFQKNYGLRIDYFYMHKNNLDLFKSCVIDKDSRALEKPSDHAGVILELNL